MDQDIGTSHHATPVRTTLHEMASGANPDRRAWKHDDESRQFASGEWVGACDSPLDPHHGPAVRLEEYIRQHGVWSEGSGS